MLSLLHINFKVFYLILFSQKKGLNLLMNQGPVLVPNLKGSHGSPGPEFEVVILVHILEILLIPKRHSSAISCLLLL